VNQSTSASGHVPNADGSSDTPFSETRLNATREKAPCLFWPDGQHVFQPVPGRNDLFSCTCGIVRSPMVQRDLSRFGGAVAI